MRADPRNSTVMPEGPPRSTRRALLAGLAATPLGGAVIATQAADPDAALLALGRRWEAAWAVQRAADRAFMALHGRRQPPGMPDAMRREGDGIHFVSSLLRNEEHYTIPEVLAFRSYKPSGFVSERAASAALARAAEIVAASEAWRDSVRAYDAASGLTAASEALDRAHTAACAICDQIQATPARTLAGAILKARIAQAEVDAGSDLPEDLVAGLVRDLAALGAVQ